MAFIHQECLTHWLSIKRASSSSSAVLSSAAARCEICHHPFAFTSEVRRSAPTAPGWRDAAVGLSEAVKEVAKGLAQWMSWRHLCVLLIIPLCPHLSRQSAVAEAQAATGLLGLLSTALSLLWFVLVNVLTLSALSFVVVFVLLSSVHGFVCLWGHELNVLVHRLKRRLRAFNRARRRRRRAAGIARDEERDEEEDGESALVMDRLVDVINVISAIDSMAELTQHVYRCHLAVSTVCIVAPYVLLHNVSAALCMLTGVPPVSAISSSLLASAVSVINGGLPLLLPSSFVSWLTPGADAVPFQLPSLVFHFTPASLKYLHALLHLAPLLYLVLFWAGVCAICLCAPVRHPLHLVVSVCLGVVLKALLLVVVEFLFLPFVMGVIVHCMCLPFLLPAPSASLSPLFFERLVYALSHPVSSSFVHWVVGTTFFLAATSFFRLLIRSMRRRVVGRVFSVDHHVDMLHEIVSTPLLSEARKIARSFTIYTLLAAALVATPGMLLYGLGLSGRLGLPVRVDMGGLLSWFIAASAVAVFVWKVWVGGKQTRRKRRRQGKRRVEQFVGRVSSWFGLREYLLKPSSEKEREMEERRERRRGMRQRRMMMAEAEDDAPFPFIDEPAAADDDVDSNDDTEDEMEAWMQAAELDHFLIEADEDRHNDDDDHPQPHHHHHHAHHPRAHAHQPHHHDEHAHADDSDEDDGDDDDDEALLNEELLQPNLPADVHALVASTITRKERDRREKEEEKAERSAMSLFWLRLIATSLSVWALAVAFVLPAFLATLGVGRLLVYAVPLGLFHANDVFALMAGHLLLSWTPWEAVSSLAQASVRLTLLKAALLMGYFAVAFPLCVGLLTQHTLMLPFRLSLHQQPVFYLAQEWCIGVVGSLFLFAGMAAVQSLLALEQRDAPGPTPLSFFSSFTLWHAHVFHVLGQPLARTRLLSLVYDVLLPPSHFFILHLALPYVVVRGLLPLRLLLPWWVRADEYVLVSYLQGDEGLAYTSRLLESAVYRGVTGAVLAARLAGWAHMWGREWLDAYKAAAFERRWGMRRLQNVEEQQGEDDAAEDEEADDDEEEEGDEENDDVSSDEEQDAVRWVEDDDGEEKKQPNDAHNHDQDVVGEQSDADDELGDDSDDYGQPHQPRPRQRRGWQ